MNNIGLLAKDTYSIRLERKNCICLHKVNVNHRPGLIISIILLLFPIAGTFGAQKTKNY